MLPNQLCLSWTGVTDLLRKINGCTCNPACRNRARRKEKKEEARISKPLQKQTEIQGRRRMTFTLFGGFLYDFYQGVYSLLLSIPLFPCLSLTLLCLCIFQCHLHLNIEESLISSFIFHFTPLQLPSHFSDIVVLPSSFSTSTYYFLNGMGKS